MHLNECELEPEEILFEEVFKSANTDKEKDYLSQISHLPDHVWTLP